MRKRFSIRPIALVAAIAALPAVTLATPESALTLQPAHSGDKVALAFTFEGHFGINRQEQLDDTIVVQQKTHGVIIVNAQKCKPFELSTTVDGSGLLAQPSSQSALGDIIIDYNSIVKLAQHASRESGAVWQAQIPVRLSPDTWQDMPVDVKVASVTSAGVALEATGHQEATLYFQGFTFPVDVTMHMAELFRPDGHFANADLSVAEVTAGGSGPPISYAWHIKAK